MSKRDRIAEEFGVTSLHDFFGTGETPSNARQMAFDELERRIVQGDLPPLNGRAVREDAFLDPEFYQEWHGGLPKGPSNSEAQELRREYGAAIDDALSGRGQPQPVIGADLAETMWREFSQQYSDLAHDASKVEAAARRVIEAGGFSPDDRAGFYQKVAREMGHG